MPVKKNKSIGDLAEERQDELRSREIRYQHEASERAIGKIADKMAARDDSYVEIIVNGNGSRITMRIEGTRGKRCSFAVAMVEAAFNQV